MNDDRGFQLATLQIMGNKRLVMLNRPDFVHMSPALSILKRRIGAPDLGSLPSLETERRGTFDLMENPMARKLTNRLPQSPYTKDLPALL